MRLTQIASVLPFIKKHVSDSSSSVTFLELLFEAERKGTIKDGVAKNIYRDVLTDLIPSFSLEKETPPPKKSKYASYPIARVDSDEPKICSIDANAVASLVDNCRTMDLNEARSALGPAYSCM